MILLVDDVAAAHVAPTAGPGLASSDAGLGSAISVISSFVTEKSDAFAGPLYLRLARGILEATARGNLSTAHRLPTERSLATALGISRSTVVAAYDLLQREGAVIRKQGSGTWLSGARPESLPAKFPRQAHSPADQPISFTLASPPANRLVHEAFDAIRGDMLDATLRNQGYESHGLLSLREAIAHYYGGLGLPTSPSQILITTGAQQGVFLTAASLVDAGDPVLVEDPTYSAALEAFQAQGARVLGVATGSVQDYAEALRNAADQKLPKLAFVIPLHHPTGALMTADAAQAIARLALELPMTVIEDRTLTSLVFDDRQTPPMIASQLPAERSIVIESLSKSFWGGLRVGWIRATESVIDRIARKKAVIDLSSSILTQLIATELVSRIPEAQAIFRETAPERLGELQALLTTYLPDWTWIEPKGGLSLWVRLPVGNATDFLRLASQYGVTAVSGGVMSTSKAFDDHLRIPFVHSSEELAEGVKRLAQAWRAYEPALGRHTSLNLVT